MVHTIFPKWIVAIYCLAVNVIQVRHFFAALIRFDEWMWNLLNQDPKTPVVCGSGMPTIANDFWCNVVLENGQNVRKAESH